MKDLRRKDRGISHREAIDLLCRAEYGILSTVDEAHQPYGVPLSYVYKDNVIYFHCALSGQKLDNLEKNEKVSFTVVGRTNVLPEMFATEYESVIVFGRAHEVTGPEWYDALLGLLEKYSPDYAIEGKHYIEQKKNLTKVFKIEINEFCGKARK